MGVEKISFCSVESQSFLACPRLALALRDHADQETKNNKRLRRLVLSKSFALARLRVAFLRASLIREDIRAVGLALAGDLITPEQPLNRFDDIMQPELS
jgi:hypothetical protein